MTTDTGPGPPRRTWLARLGPQGEVDLGRAALPPTVIEDAVARLGRAPVCWAIELSSVVVQRIVAEVPHLGGSPAAVEMLRRGNEATTVRALATLTDSPAAVPPAAEATLEGIREFVHRTIPLEYVLQGVRIGHAATTEAFLRACTELVDPDMVVEEVTAVSRELFSYVDDLSDAMVRTYLVEHEAWSTSAAAARAGLVRSLLGDAATVDAEEASRALGYNLRRTHEAVVVWSDTPDTGSTLQGVAIEVLRARGATATLTVPVAAGQLWAWGAVPARSSRVDDGWEVDDGWKSVTESLSRRQVQAAFGTPGAGVAGFARSHREAQRAQQIGQLRRRAGLDGRPVTDYADMATVALLATDLKAAADFVRRELGALAAPGPTTEALRTTLYHYLDAERSLAEVARRLHVARATVTYRVKRAQEFLGHDLDDHRFALHSALALAEELGDAVLLPHTSSGEGLEDHRQNRRLGPADQQAGGSFGSQTKSWPGMRS
ncbi:PucR family transcriptional regulator [Streptomyces sp. MMBL 11-3]|uniref:PucR family transcriptional regulator n=1 Tax=Streptomyces sp. MMBL 11-3 TaxID=3382639 RepID=UPI0039B68BB0